MDIMYNTKQAKITAALSLLGSVAGIIVAVKRKSGFWGGVGWFIVGGMAGTAIGWLATSGSNETVTVTTTA